MKAVLEDSITAVGVKLEKVNFGQCEHYIFRFGRVIWDNPFCLRGSDCIFSMGDVVKPCCICSQMLLSSLNLIFPVNSQWHVDITSIWSWF